LSKYINKHKPYGIYEKCFKRAFDVTLSTGALIVLSPVMGITALLVRNKLGTPVIYTQERPGLNEEIFKLYKFRTMTNETDRNGELLPDADRLTDFGKMLRSTSLDELPELINIIKGDMSIVGPRPLLKQYLPYYTNEERKRHVVRPGLTGLAQINGRNALAWGERLKLDVKYADNVSFFGDIRIVLITFFNVIKHKDVVDAGNYEMLNLDEERKLQYADS